MEIIAILLLVAAVFGICFLVDKGFTKLFRNQKQHKSGKAVRANKRYATVGLVLSILGVATLFQAPRENVGLLLGGVAVLIVGAGLILYYLSYGVFYDEDTMLVTGFGKKKQTWKFSQIQSQKLYLIQGGSVVVELHMEDGKTISVQTRSMEGTYPFLDHAFAAWCRQKGLDPETCDFHDPANSKWFPTVEDV